MLSFSFTSLHVHAKGYKETRRERRTAKNKEKKKMPTCRGKANRNAHPETTMIFVKSWRFKGRNQKKEIIVELWKCPYFYHTDAGEVPCNNHIRLSRKPKEDKE
jgi:hypothetical protein